VHTGAFMLMGPNQKKKKKNIVCKYINESVVQLDSFIPLARAECDDSLPFSGAPSIPFCYIGCIT
jgi:hypothetical protein